MALYWRLPGPVRDLAATVHGAKLVRQRYGPDTDEAVAAAHEREHWSAPRWQEWREARLHHILERARTQVPWYREHWDRRQRSGDRASWEDLANWPILTKEELRQAPEAFVADDRPTSGLIVDHTSGTTGTPLTLWFSPDEVRAWYAIFEARVRQWYGVDRHTPMGMLGGQEVVDPTRDRPPYWVVNRAMHQMYLSTRHLRDDRAADYIGALRRQRAQYLLGYTSALVALAEGVARSGIEAPAMKVAITNAEPCTDADREIITGTFAGPTRATYGMSEVVAHAVECEAGSLHDLPEVGWLELDPDSRPTEGEAPGAGDLIATGLINASQPLVRYRVGDRISLPEHQDCACGRTLPVIASVTGRTDDVVIAPDGRRVGRLDPIFKADLPLREAQIVQESRTLLRVLVVPADGYGPDVAAVIEQRTKDRVGDMDVQVEAVTGIPRTANGKFRAVVSRLSPEERRA